MTCEVDDIPLFTEDNKEFSKDYSKSPVTNKTGISEKTIVSPEINNHRNNINITEGSLSTNNTENKVSSLVTELSNESNNYLHQEKKSPIIYILLCIIGVLILGIGLLGGILLTKNKTQNNDN